MNSIFSRGINSSEIRLKKISINEEKNPLKIESASTRIKDCEVCPLLFKINFPQHFNRKYEFNVDFGMTVELLHTCL